MQDKKPLIIGLGLTGKSLVNFLSKSHDELFVVSESFKPHEIEDIEKLGMKLHLNPTIDEDLIDKFDELGLGKQARLAIQEHIGIM